MRVCKNKGNRPIWERIFKKSKSGNTDLAKSKNIVLLEKEVAKHFCMVAKVMVLPWIT